MSNKYDFSNLKQEWPKIRERLFKVSQDAMELAKKGEEELVRFSQKSKLHIDATALNIKKEHLYHLIGKEYLRARCPAKPTAKLKKLVEEFGQLERETRALRRNIRKEQGLSSLPGAQKGGPKGRTAKTPKKSSKRAPKG